MSSLVSVVITCYNREQFIRHAVDSALLQTWPHKEVIVVDDGSCDHSTDILKGYGSQIKLICKPNGGSASARNAGISAVSGDWVAFLDSDDYWYPEKLERQMKAALDYPCAALVCTGKDQVDVNGEVIQHNQSRNTEVIDNPICDLLRECFPLTSSVLVRKQVLLEAGGFDNKFRHREDWELYLRLADVGPFIVVGEALTCYRIHPHSKTQGESFEHLVGLIELRRRIDSNVTHWQNTCDLTKLSEALAYHNHQFAAASYDLGKIMMKGDNWRAATAAFRDARNHCPLRLKHHTRFWWSVLRSQIPFQNRRITDCAGNHNSDYRL